MFGRLNAKLKHLKENPHSAQIAENSAGPSSVTSESPVSVSPSAFGSYTTSNTPTATSRAASPSATLSGGFQAARAAAAAKGLALNTHVRQQQHQNQNQQQQQQPAPVPSNSDSPALRSYHLYVGTPLENAFSPLISPTTAGTSERTSPPAKRRLSSPHIGHARNVVACDIPAHPAKHTRTEGHEDAGESLTYYHQPSSIPLPAAGGSTYAGHLQKQLQSQLLHPGQLYLQQQPVALPAGILHVQASMLSQSNQPPQQHVYGQQQQPSPLQNGSMTELHGAVQSAPSTMTQSVCGHDNEQPAVEGRTLNDFQLLHTLGTGTFGRVFLCQSRATQRYYAMKVLRKSQVVKLKQVEHINNEKNILEVSRFPFIVQLECTMQNERNLYMLMEYVPGGELFSHLRRAGRFPDDVARFYAAEIVLALDYLHSMKIIWRDTKPENILLDSAGHVKLTDFGFAKRVEGRTWTLCGTPEYLAPEIIQSKGHGKAVDWWALGILIFEMLAGYPPFYDDNPFGIYEKILEGKLVFPAFFSAASKDLIQRLLTPDVSKRLGNLQGEGREVKAHPWFAMIDWDVLVCRQVPAPIVPPHRHPGDTCNFDKYPEPPKEPAPEPGVDPYYHLFSTF
ncbi:Pkinase-domain-containing protein [Coemansia reversa NRRL 1564]|uniref:cAMP-dependent protein kinase n=1 Tax=Coemansia reversa (strain ATCC 12441 / NRRL 1564) TaxID=763665 RepID=A0A2G5BDF7_COERN|nr:Pkinase-domain-containing protein [Coemansia reversa NRRL 1564]|eukprot:PIA17050.1 Pkinase-domain-containing protein [Coemansia reversa NRRL 1564]